MHAVGYCLGGTLLSIAAAAMARDGDDRLKTLTLLAAQTDFTEAGELMLFINESQVAFLEDMMWEQGFLDATQMAGAFQILRSNDLVWSRMVRDYLMGERKPMIDLMAWNADATRLPYRMHSEYLRRLFLNNDLAEGRYTVASDRSRSRISARRSSASAPCVTTSRPGGPPTRSIPDRHRGDLSAHEWRPQCRHRVRARSRSPRLPGDDEEEKDRYIDPEAFLKQAPQKQGSWWPEWTAWLAARSGEAVDAPAMGGAEHAALADAPGSYVCCSKQAVAAWADGEAFEDQNEYANCRSHLT